MVIHIDGLPDLPGMRPEDLERRAKERKREQLRTKVVVVAFVALCSMPVVAILFTLLETTGLSPVLVIPIGSVVGVLLTLLVLREHLSGVKERERRRALSPEQRAVEDTEAKRKRNRGGAPRGRQTTRPK